jgi:hypothetical protein
MGLLIHNAMHLDSGQHCSFKVEKEQQLQPPRSTWEAAATALQPKNAAGFEQCRSAKTHR